MAKTTATTAAPAPAQANMGACGSCGATLDSVQRYCLGCGAAVAGMAPPLETRTAEQASPPVRPATIAPRQATAIRPLAALGAASLAGAMLMLVLFAALGGKVEPQPIAVNVPAAKAPVVNVQGGGAAAPATETPFVSDWPGGDGWTVSLQTLPKTGTPASAVTAAKATATAAGAKDAGALDSDEFSALEAEQYLVYSGVFRKKAEAESALKRLKASFPGAKIVRVADADAGGGKTKKATAQDLKDLRSSSGDAFTKKSEKLPDSVGTPGPALPKEETPKPAGDEDDVDTIG